MTMTALRTRERPYMGPMITAGTCAHSNAEAFAKLAEMYLAEGTGPILDMTFGDGVFWRLVSPAILHRLVRAELVPGKGCPDLNADAYQGPFRDECFDAVVFDPPYMTQGGVASVKESIAARYGVRRLAAIPWGGRRAFLVAQYADARQEALRTLRPGGIFIMKGADEGRHEFVVEQANIVDDLELVIAACPYIQAHDPADRWRGNQYKPRQNYSYFRVMQKPLHTRKVG